MVVLLVTKAHMGVSQFDKVTSFGSFCSSNLRLSSGFVICEAPLFSFGLKSNKVNKNHGVLLGSRNCGKINVLLKGGAGESGIVEKEFEFKPSFDEYLKAMESVKIVREKRKQAKRKKINGEESHKLGDLEKKICQDKSKIFDLGKDSGVLEDARKVEFGEKNSVEDAVNVKRKSQVETQNGIWTNNQNGSVKETQRYDKFEEDRIRGNSGHQIQKRDESAYAQNAPQNVIRGRDNKRGNVDRSNGEIENDRAAFRSFEEDNVVYDMPRASRMDMEEKIQKLAKCLNGADADMPEWMFSKVMRSAKIRFADHSMVRVIQILGKLGNWKRVLQVIEWINSRERFTSHKLRHIYTAALDALGKARRPVEALNLFYMMQQQMSTYPDLVAYHCIAVALGQAGHMKELFDVIDSMHSPPKKKFKTGVIEKWDPRLKPDIVVYNAVLNACVHRKKWEGTFWVLQQLKEEGQQPTSATYGLIMEAMFACGKYDLVHVFFEKVQRSSIPNALTYKVLVNTHWKEGNIDKAVMAVKDMERRGIIGSSGLYYDLARSLCSAGRCKEALMQVDKICRVANKPLVVTYTGLIQACLDSGNIQDGIYIFKHMENFCSPNLVTCNIMLKAYLDHEMFEEARALFQKLVESCNHIGSKLEYKNRVIADSYTFNLMLDACLVQQRWNDLEFVYRRMLKHGYHFNARRHLRIIMDACRGGKMELLETTWKHLVQADRLPPPLLVKQMFCLKLQQNDYAAAFSCATNHPSSELPEFSPKSWLHFLRENSQRLKKETLLGFVHEASIITARSDSCNQIIENLNTACREYLRTT